MSDEPRLSIAVDRDLPCRLRDGTVLRGDLYRRSDGPPAPVLVHRTPYDKQHPTFTTSLMIHPFDAVERGYAVYVQDARGRFASDGDWTPFHCEREDGYDTIEWAAEQPWSNGKVGIYGSSYMGVTTVQALASRPPRLTAAAAYLTGSNYFDGFVYSGGALELLFILRWTAAQAVDSLRRATVDEATRAAAGERLLWILGSPAEASRFRPLIEVFGAADFLVPHWRNWLQHVDYDAFWQATDPLTEVSRSAVPLLSIAGWYDGFLKGQIDLHQTLSDSGRSAPETLILGPWDHEAYLSLRPTSAGDRSFGPTVIGGVPGFNTLVLDWFDRWMKPEAVPAEPVRSSCRYFVIGPDEWRHSDSWPPEGRTLTLYLDGAPAASSGGEGRLSPEKPAAASRNVIRHDPANPVPTAGGRHLGYWYGHAGIQDQAADERRGDVLVFTGAPLEEPVTLQGGVEAELWVAFDARSADFAAKLVDVGPDGYCANVVEGISRVERQSDALQKVTIDLWHGAWVFAEGHRLRLEIAASNYPRFDVNLGLGKAENFRAGEITAPFAQSVESSAETPSFVTLQVDRT